MLLIIDNYDSFTYNLVHEVGRILVAHGLGADMIKVLRNDRFTPDDILAENPKAVIISPGPGTPDEAGHCLEMTKKIAARGTIPLLGVCLGHQVLGQSFGGIIRRADPVHGKVSSISHHGQTIFAGINAPLEMTRYHSLVLERESLPDMLEVTAWDDKGLVMGVSHKTLPLHGVQFHPESIASPSGPQLLANFLNQSQVFLAKV